MEIERSLPPSLRLVLASASPRRRELLTLLGLPYEVIPSRYEEPSALQSDVELAAFVTHLAIEKAREVAARCGEAWILGADTEVSFGTIGRPMGKPADFEEAERMLHQLAGREHFVTTGVALLQSTQTGNIVQQFTIAVQTRVRFRPLDARMIADYVATGEPMDKAGAYGAQGLAAPFIEAFDGDFFNVVGLPLCAVGKLLEQAGILWWTYRTTA